MIDEGCAQWPRIGAFRFNFMQRTQTPFNPVQLFKAGDIGGFITSSDINSLFQTRTGPTVPVTGDGDPVEFVTPQNAGGLPFNRPLTSVGYDYLGGLLLGRDAAPQFSLINTATLGQGFSQLTVVVGLFIGEPDGPPSTSELTIAQASVQNTSAFGGAQITVDRRADRSVRATFGTWVPPSGNPTSQITVPNVDHTVMHVVGGRFDQAAPNQNLFFDDVETNPVLAYSEITAQASAANLSCVSALTNPAPDSLLSFTSGMFYINRRLTDEELSQLKQWFVDLIPDTPS